MPDDPTARRAMIDYGAVIREDRVHGSLYVDAEVFAEEMSRIYARGWVFVGHDRCRIRAPVAAGLTPRVLYPACYGLSRDSDHAR